MSNWPFPSFSGDESPMEQPVDAESLLRWQNLLDTLEQEAETALAGSEDSMGGHPTWSPPADLGPLPEIFAERARSLASRQRLGVASLAASLSTIEVEMAELTRPRKQVQPLYVDVTG